MRFVAIDVETANADFASICQVGLAEFQDGALTREWKSYVDPQDDFDAINVALHGIHSWTVRGAPTFPEVFQIIRPALLETIVVCHTHFDRVALHQASAKHDISLPELTWLDSARVARRTWTKCAWKGYGLRDVCRMLGYNFTPHDALEDAKAAAHVLLAAIRDSGLDVDGWLKRVRQPMDLTAAGPIRRDGNPQGALWGEVMVFTGALVMPRREAADMAASIGCQVDSNVTKRTTLLVVGDQDLKRLAGHEKSLKHRKAEDLMHQGISIRILRETDFRELVRLSD